jgi:uncharacterized membrane protein
MRARTVGVGIALVAYVVASHWLMTTARHSPWNLVLVVAPPLALLLLYARQRGQQGPGIVAGLALVLPAWLAWRDGGRAAGLLHLAPHLAVYAVLATVFTLSLRRGREPLVTALVRRVHGHLTPGMAAYSRRVTVAWAICFAAIVLISIALFALAPFELWAAFANFGAVLAMALLFLGEYALRYRLHPEFERASLGAALRAYARHDRRATGSGP